uniref:MARVEL domain-containing protein n=1 Tax=Heliothis virescens TaxID=7102 RepID=A0A2A4JY57_HELVI
MWLEKLAPRSFICRYDLRKGSLSVGIFMLIISIICVITLAVQILYYKECNECTALVIHNAYSFSINALIYCIFMIFINIWFIWGVQAHKSSVVLSWVVLTCMWWAQSVTLVFILLCMYITDTSLGWLVALGCAVVAFMILLYFILVGYGYWLEIRKSSHTSLEVPDATS